MPASALLHPWQWPGRPCEARFFDEKECDSPQKPQPPFLKNCSRCSCNDLFFHFMVTLCRITFATTVNIPLECIRYVPLYVYMFFFVFNLGCYLFQKTEISDLSVLDPLVSPASTSLPPPRDITTLRQLLHIWSGPPRQLRPHNAPCQVHAILV